MIQKQNYVFMLIILLVVVIYKAGCYPQVDGGIGFPEDGDEDRGKQNIMVITIILLSLRSSLIL